MSIVLFFGVHLLYTVVVIFQEYEIDKVLGIKCPEDVERMGIDKYNAECRKIVMRYANEWEVCIRCSRYFLTAIFVILFG